MFILVNLPENTSLKLVSGIYTLILTHRRQVSHRVVFFLSRYLVSRLIVLYLVYYLILNVPLYVDDLAIYYSSSHMPSIERKLQQSLNRLGRWCDENGFKFSPTKTVCSFWSTTKTSFRSTTLPKWHTNSNHW